MIENIIISLLSIQLIQFKLNYLGIDNLDHYNIVQLPKFNMKGTKL